MTDLLARARAFAAEDPDPETRAELTALLARVATGQVEAGLELEDRFATSLHFGTAGLRGRLAAGTARMNRVVVMRAAWGLGRHLMAQAEAGALSLAAGVVVGFDGRRYSRQFAEDTAAVLAGLSIPVHLFDDLAATPLVAFAIEHLGAAAGVMVTASHNPPADNGYKVYWGNGAQIVPPHDTGIAAWIDRAPPIPQMARPSPFDAAARGLRLAIDDRVIATYLDRVHALSVHPGAAVAQPLRLVYSAMHGVGHPLVVRALRRAGFAAIASVPSQTDADGAFPTVAFPNPEEDGAMDRALALAEELDADLVLANDPDADRLAVAVPVQEGGARRWHMLSGNDIGILLGADHLAWFDTGGRKKLAVTTIVSSTMLGRIAADLGASCAITLTGFKWLATTALAREAALGEAFVFGYEEALGYCCGGLVHDKDGVSAAVRMAELAAWLRGQGRTLLDELDRLALAHGIPVSSQWSVRLPGRDGRVRIDAAMARLRREPPTELAGVEVVRRLDLLERTSWAADGQAPALDLPEADVLVFHDARGTRLVVRPSGTEPKIKFYLDSAGHADDAAGIAAERAAQQRRLQAIRDAIMVALALL